jgi:alanine racemase
MTAIAPQADSRREPAPSLIPNGRSVTSSATAVLRIDRMAVQKNYAHMRAQTAAGVRHGAVLKSDAYGLGARPIAEALVEAGCTLFFVADLDAALALRAAFPKVAIVALDGYSQQRASDYRDHDIVAVANDLHDIATLRQGTSSAPYILNIDTGLNRRGLPTRAVARLYLAGLFDRLPPTGVMSHLACAAAADHPMNDLQLRRFQQLYALLRPAWGSLAASCGVWLGPRYHFDVTRLGSALYGLNDRRMRPSPLQAVLTLSAQVVEVRALCAAETVGYGAIFRAERPTRLAVVGMGYAHGLPRTDHGLVARIGRFLAPAVGRLSMEWLTLDVSDVPEALCHRGTWVSLLDVQTTIDDLADATGVAAPEIQLRLGTACRREHTAFEPRAASTESAWREVASVAPSPMPVRRDRSP